MPIISIPYQPATSQLLAAYRPVVFKVQATRTDGSAQPPYVSCDIYIADMYYKSVIRTAPETIANEYSIFQFDISDALQEYLQPDLATLNNDNLLQAPHMSAKVFCRFRSSGIDSNGFTVEEGTKPVQGTKFTSPASGTGTQSNTFFAINAALQHEDNQNLAVHLNAYKQGTWAANAYPLTHRNRYFFCNDDSDHFPFIYSGDCLQTDIILNYRLKGQTSFSQVTATDINVCTGIGFTPTVTGNRVDVHLDTAIPVGQSVLVQYKKQSDSVWIDAGTYTTQDFSFNVNGSELAGDYDIRVILFCTPCLSSDPEVGTFTLSGEEINLAWRGIVPFCVQQTFPSPIYISLEIRDETTEDDYFPDNINPTDRTFRTHGKLFAKFFSDLAMLNPVTITQTGLKIYVKSKQIRAVFDGTYNFNNEFEGVLTFTENVAGTEVQLGVVDVNTVLNFEHYDPYPTIATTDYSTYEYTPYPTIELAGGNTGQLGYATLEEYNTDTNIPTGNYKNNDVGDPDYIAPTTNETLCPSGPDVTTVTYGYSLNVSKVQLNYNTTENLYSTPVAGTSGGGWVYVLPLPKNTPTTVSVKAKTLDSGNTNGYVKARVGYYDSGGNYQTFEWNIPNDIETTIPGTFSNIVNVNISNY